MINCSFLYMFIDQPVEELQEKDAIPLGEREEVLQLPLEKVLTTPAVRKMALDHNVTILDQLCHYFKTNL